MRLDRFRFLSLDMANYKEILIGLGAAGALAAGQLQTAVEKPDQESGADATLNPPYAYPGGLEAKELNTSSSLKSRASSS